MGLLLALLLPGLAVAAGPDLTGWWTGGIDIAGNSLGIEVQLQTDDAGQLQGTLSIPAQEASGLPFAAVEQQGDHLLLTIDLPGGASFEGALTADGGIQGTFTQAGQPFPFSLQRRSSEPPVIDSGLAALQGLDQFVTETMQDWHVPGTAVAVVQNGEVVYAKGFGLRDLAGQLPVTTETQFGIGSATKAFTTALIGMLVDQQQLAWDTPVKEYIPGFELADSLAGDRIALRDLAVHRSGLPRNDFAIMFNPELTRSRVVEQLDTLQPNVDFRTTWQYNNLGYVVAGYAAEQVTGETWEQLVQERILTPLGMTDTSLSVAGLQATSDHALAYLSGSGSVPQLTEFWQLGASAPCGAINSSVLDMAEWLKFQLNNGKVGEQQLLSAYQLAQMHSPQMLITSTVSDGPVQFSSYGLGWMVESYRGSYLVHHGGNVIGQTAEVALFPAENSGVVVLSNLQGTPVPSLVMYNVIDRLAGREPYDLNRELLQQQAAASAAVGSASQTTSGTKAPAAAALQEYTGLYRHPFYGDVRISLVKGQLQAAYYQTEIKLTHQNHDVFSGQTALWPIAIPFQFQRNLSGTVDQVLIGFEPAGAALAFSRQAEAQPLDSSLARKLAGKYDVQGASIQVSYVDGQLTMVIPGQPQYTLQQINGNNFSLQGYAGYSVEFVLDQSGKVTAIVFTQPNGVFRGSRVTG